MKYCYLNALTFSELYLIFGEEDTLNSKGKTKAFNKSVLLLNGFNEIKLEKVFASPLKKLNEQLLTKILAPLSNRQDLKYKYIDNNLNFCPLCITNKFHSTLHQFSFVHTCPFHNVKLINCCPKCKAKIPYDLNNGGTINNKYACTFCSFEYSSDERHLNYDFYPKISDKNVERWLTLNINEINKIRTSIIFDEHFLKMENEEVEFKYDIPFLLSILNEKDSCKHKSRNQYLDKCLVKERVRKRPYLKNEYYYESLFENKDVEYSYNETDKLFNSISRHLRKTILKNHISCIKELTRYRHDINDENLCPIAIAYVYWRLRLQGFKSYEDVDNWGTAPIYRFRILDYGYPVSSLRFKNWLKELEGEGILPSSISLSRHTYLWIINNFIGEMIWAEFYRCLEYALNWNNQENIYTIDSIFTFKYMSKLIIFKTEGNYYLIKGTKSELTDIKKKLILINEKKCVNNNKFRIDSTYVKPKPKRYFR
ncbi:hypothetical protein [Bacillus sp. CHD6a]|uniref:hypothetical protein n=1 Tax=Bacillus sp. CHD6a TaxID=1643452 RepID=UPI0006CE1F98|nr:hypothetical protein [Bacillus sp. CHD6a]KPB06371.1 hypothetical protein AAV98_00800 [Bacillus sp. CHD6a]